MYRGFNIKCKGYELDYKYYKLGSEVQNAKKEQIKNKFKHYLIDNETLSGNEIMDQWFPKNEYHIFLSHSHNDLDLALNLAGILKQEHNLNVFVDSNVWLNCKDLLKLIDDHYCKNINDSNYNYQARNYSTSHVHMMLMNSLNSTINSSEALFFLNTPNSISAKEVIKQETFSPWIFAEIETSKIINKVTPERLFEKTKMFSKSHKEYVALNESDKRLQISYELELGHLTDLSSDEFEEWINNYYTSPENALDSLYNNKSLHNILIK